MDQRVAQLNAIAKQLFEIAETLNAGGVNCESCGSFRRADFPEWALRQKVEGAMVTISNLASAFEKLPEAKARQSWAGVK